MWASILRFSASHSSTLMLTTALLAATTAGAWYVQGLRVKAARCEATQEIMGRYEKLADRLERELNDELEAAESEIGSATHPCLDVTTDELLGNSLDASRVPHEREGG